MVYPDNMLYAGIWVTALIVGFFSFRAVNSRNCLIKAALYHYFLNSTEAKSETHVKGASLPSTAYGLAIGKFQKMKDGRDDYTFCFEILNHQIRIFGDRNAMLKAARRRHFPK
ncbi:hypothetical protein [Marinobacter arenosus]|uniref:hypothetical protein n=1 Tax=Marinobacter arenosus TaxID=2856822 RepID=UPI001C4CFEE0|nr:hypothetical protein [Marinobacter arenosus]MBW0147345.1 hypothetical protein [Marinobacter arenosus]